ncbi:MAG TPA: SBBP repeat-containing protein [Bryobacteraceae bacterium]|nr:SBBP repeat-containing protein [Bryobacteraceae bacterium]
MEARIQYPVLKLVALSLLGFGGMTSHSLAQRVSASKFRRAEEHTSPANTMLGGNSRHLTFIENRGQFDAQVKFQAKGGGKVLWFTSTGLVFDVVHPTEHSKTVNSHSGTMGGLTALLPPRVGSQFPPPGEKFERLVFSEDFVQGLESPKIEASAPQPGVYNYFIGSDRKNWQTGVVGYSQLIYRNVWPGIDIRFVVNGGDIEQEFVVHPGSDPSRIGVRYSGVNGLHIATDGSLIVQTLLGSLRESAPRVYSENRGSRTSVHGSYKISGTLAYAFQLGSYRKESPLVIDPTLLFATYVGGPGADIGQTIAVDPAGNTYVAGYTLLASGYPITPGVVQPACPSSANCSSAVVTKLDALGRLQYSTYLGNPAGGDRARGIAVDASGEAYVTGLAQSDGFPTTSNSFQSGCSGSSFVTKLNSNGTALLYSTCLGADDQEATAFDGVGGANGIAVDMSGRAYLTGDTASGTFPTTSSALQRKLAGTVNAFVAVVDPSLSGGSSLVYSTLVGGEVQDFGRAIAVDIYGNAYITGNTFSSHFPVTPSAFQATDNQANCGTGAGNAQCSTGFVAKLNPNIAGPTGLIYASYLGGNVGNTGGSASVGDYGYAIAVDSSGNAHVAGNTNSLNFPTTAGSFQSSSTCSTAGFLAKLNAGGSALIFSTLIFGTGPGSCLVGVSGIALDSSNDAYLVGTTGSRSFPVTPNAFQSAFHGVSYDAFLTELNASGSSLIYSTYLGGSGDDYAAGVAVDVTGDAYVTGTTSSIDFPITPFAFQPVYGGNGGDCNFTPCGDIFVTKFPLGAPGGLSITGIVPSFGGNAGTVSPQIVGSGFHAGVIAHLNCGGQSVVGANVSVGPGGRLLNTTFDLTVASAGPCNVVVTNPDGTLVTLPQAFTVQQGGAPNIRLYLTGLEVRKVPVEVSLGPADAVELVTVSNTGSIDSTGGIVSLPLSPPFTLTSSSPPGFGKPGDEFDVHSSAPTAPGGSQTFTTTAAAQVATACNNPPLGAQVCINSAPSTDWTQFESCLANTNTFGVGTACYFAARTCQGTCAAAETPLGIALCVTDCLLGGAACGVPAWPGIKSCLANSQTPGPQICLSDQLPCAEPADPNYLIGPSGIGNQHWIAGVTALTYEISFSNEPTAPVPAQQVIVTQPLGASVNLATLALPLISIPNGSINIQVLIPPGSFNPAAGINEFMTNVDLRPTESLLVNVEAKLDLTTQTLTWTFKSIDPTTGLPPFNPLVGFLPPGAGANVSFSVTPKPGIANGTQVSDQATVVFDGQTPMSTQTWVNTIDNKPPVSRVAALPVASTCPSFRIGWSGNDLGSGLQGFTVYVSDNGGAFTSWLSNTTATAGTFSGSVGHTYAFYTIATDLTGNVEAVKTFPEASTTLTATGPCGPPSLSAQVLSVAQSGTTVTASLQLTNNGLTAAQAVNINQITLRTLSGIGTVTLSGPTLPLAVGSLAIGASTTVPFTFNVPNTVTRFSATEGGTIQDASGNGYSFSIAQTIIP